MEAEKAEINMLRLDRKAPSRRGVLFEASTSARHQIKLKHEVVTEEKKPGKNAKENDQGKEEEDKNENEWKRGSKILLGKDQKVQEQATESEEKDTRTRKEHEKEGQSDVRKKKGRQTLAGAFSRFLAPLERAAAGR